MGGRRSPPSPLAPIFLIVLVDVFGMTLVIPLLAIYAESFGATPLDATLLVSTYAVCQLVSGPLLGRASDRMGRKPLLLVSQAGTFVGFLLMARASALWMVYLARVIDGATAGNLALAQAYISDNTERSERARSFALIGIAFGVGFFIGPALTAKLVSYGLSAPVYLAAGLSMTSILCTAFLLPQSRPPSHGSAGPLARLQSAGGGPADADPGPRGRRPSLLAWATFAEYLRRPVLGGLFAQFLFFGISFATFTSGFALFAERRFVWRGHPFGVREIGYVFAYSGLLGIVIQGGLIGRLVKRFGEPPLAAVGFACMAMSYATLSFAHTIGWLVVAATLAALGTGINRPVLTSLISQTAGRHEQGAVLGVNQSLMSMAQICAPALAGTLIGQGRLAVWALVAAGASLVGLGLSRWGSGRAHQREMSSAPT
jgi:MFS family permease